MSKTGILAKMLVAALVLALLLNGAAPAGWAAGTWEAVGSLGSERANHSATLLPDGRVLVAGGDGPSGALSSAELYDPLSGTWSPTGSLNTARYAHTATLLPDGRVLVAGGDTSSGTLSSAELYDPVSGTWSYTGSLNEGRKTHSATLLADGRVLAAGGDASGGALDSAELYDPASGTWSSTGSLNEGRFYHTATLLADGKVLVVGGSDGVQLTSAELYDPDDGTWSFTGSLGEGRQGHQAMRLPDGQVLAAGGWNSASKHLASAELYDPVEGTWSTTGSMGAAHSYFAEVLLPDGRVLAAGGWAADDNAAGSEVYDPADGTWAQPADLVTGRASHSATLLADGRVLVAGGMTYSGTLTALASAEVYAPAAGDWQPAASLNTGRVDHTATLLLDGRVLAVGGFGVSPPYAQAYAELFDPESGTWSPTGSMNEKRALHSATLLADGRVLVAGGSYAGSTVTAELYDPVSGEWSYTGSMHTGRQAHSATLLADGRVLVAGGLDRSYQPTASVEIYDPESGTWSVTGSLAVGRGYHSATLLADGRVLAAAGYDAAEDMTSAEIFDPATGTWGAADSLGNPRFSHSATLLPDGRVLVAGGLVTQPFGISLTSCEIFDPLSGTWSATGSLNYGRHDHSALLLADGRVLAAAGRNLNTPLQSTELYNPAAGTWSYTDGLDTQHTSHASLAPLLDGRVMMVGGYYNAEIFDRGLGYDADWRPGLSAVPADLYPGQELQASGSGWRGYMLGEASGGAFNSSATNYPLVQLSRLDNGQQAWLPLRSFTETQLTAAPLEGMLPGPALVTVYVNGIPSQSKTILVKGPPRLRLGKEGSGAGTVSSTPAGIDCGAGCLAEFAFNQPVTLTASAAVSSTFGGWSGACSGMGSCEVSMDADQVVSATFALRTFTITPTAGEHGSLTPALPQTVTYGSSLSFNLTPDTGYSVADVVVDGASLGKLESYRFDQITASHTISATFALRTFTITPTAGEHGSLTPALPQTVTYGSSITFDITPDSGYSVADVEVDGASVGKLESYSFALITASHTISAAFASTDASLSSLLLSQGTLAPAFDPATRGYKAEVPNAVSSLVVTPTVSEAHAAIHLRVNGGAWQAAVSGQPSEALPLEEGENVIELQVTAQDGGQQVYTVRVRRWPPPLFLPAIYLERPPGLNAHE
jgi:N-acetylneuraminic acid mutarotase